VAVAALLHSPNGPVFRRLFEAAEVVKQGAIRRVGVSQPDPVPRSSPRRPNHLRDLIVKRIRPDGAGGFVVEVGVEDPIALFHHEGTEPHEITPTKSRFLVFFWPRAGRVVYLRHVNHPGTRPNRFLTDSLADLRGLF
jgi:hypothetical protein